MYIDKLDGKIGGDFFDKMRSAALASMVEASTPMRSPFTRPASPAGRRNSRSSGEMSRSPPSPPAACETSSGTKKLSNPTWMKECEF